MATQAFERDRTVRPRRPDLESVFRNVDEQRLASGLGWFSIGLGLAEIAAPEQLAKFLGVRDHAGVIRGLGLREITSGIGILTQRRPAGWVFSRVAGDAMDISLLGAALNSRNRHRGRAIGALAAVAGVTVLDLLCAEQLSRSPETGYRAIRVQKSITVNRPQEEVYRFWRNFQDLPRFMKHVESVQLTGDKRSHWRVKGPAGKTVEWDAEIIDDNPNDRIAWRTVEGSDVEHSGSVRFEPAPGGRGTVVRVDLQYAPPGPAMTVNLAKLFGEEPSQQLADDLRAFKQVMETGEVVRSDASIHRGAHAAQPPARDERRRMASR